MPGLEGDRVREVQRPEVWGLKVRRLTSYPRTLIFENDNTALPEVGLPIDVAGRKVVKMSMFFTCGSNDLASVGFERMR